MKISIHPAFLKKLVYVFFIVFISCAQNNKGKETFNASNLNSHDRIEYFKKEIPAIMKSAMIPGLSFAVISDGELLWENGFGVKSMETNEAVTPETIFEAASLSKVVFSYAVMKMVEKKELDIDEPLLNYATDEYIEKHFLNGEIEDDRIRIITARMVLSHTTGFPNWRGDNPLIIQFEPGSEFSYSGEGFGYLQKIVEKISGLPINKFMEKEVFNPLGMIHSSYNWREGYEKSTALPHNIMQMPEEKRRIESGHVAAHLHTTVSDYARFLLAIINHEGIQESTLKEMFTPQVLVDPEKAKNLAWGLGVGLQVTEKNISCWHWGDNRNFKSFFIVNPEHKDGIVYFSNSYYGLAIREELVEMTMDGENPVLHSSILKKYGHVNSPWMQFLSVLVNENVNAALEEYRQLNETYPAHEIIPEAPMNEVGYFLLRNQQYQDAISVFTLNVLIYPKSWNVYDSLGEAFMEAGNNERAIENYQKSLELNPNNRNAAKMIEKLKQEL